MGSGTAISNVAISSNTFYGYNSPVRIGSIASDVVVSGNTFLNIANGAGVALVGGSTISALSISGNTFKGYNSSSTGLIDATGTPITNSVISGNVITANSGGASAYCINLPASGTTGNKIQGNVMSGFTVQDLLVPTYLNNGCAVNGTFTLTMTGITGTTTRTAHFTVDENSYTLFLPAIIGSASGTAITLTGLPTALRTSIVQSFALCGVVNAGANDAGAVQIAASSSTLNLYTGFAFGSFAGTSTQEMQATTINIQLA